MPSATVYFATNRNKVDTTDLSQRFGTTLMPPADASSVTYARAFVDGIDLADEDSGVITSIDNLTQSRFADGDVADIGASGRNLLIFIHGFDNSFSDAIKRAAFNRVWFAASGIAAADCTMLAFTWPSLGQAISFPFIERDYDTDQLNAGLSGAAVVAFLQQLEPIIATARAAGKRVFLLAHSMGNHVLSATVEQWFANRLPGTMLFDEVFLAAADEDYDNMSIPTGSGLGRLRQLARRISVLWSVNDVAMAASFVVNHIQRLGYSGPEHLHDPSLFALTQFRMVDAGQVNDFPLTAFDASHQYYRRSPKVRGDIAVTMAGSIQGGGFFTL
jgi:esterase/lipase superfamily enzyme